MKQLYIVCIIFIMSGTAVIHAQERMIDNLSVKIAEQKDVPQNALMWMDSILKIHTNPHILDLSSPRFFDKGKSKVVGYIKNYNQRLGFSNAQIYTYNPFLDKSVPSLVTIYPDGRFEAELSLATPSQLTLSLDNKKLGIYLEPNDALAIIVDWENIEHDVSFAGEHIAQINRELKYVEDSIGIADYRDVYWTDSFTPEEYLERHKQVSEDYRNSQNSFLKNKTLNQKTLDLIQTEQNIREAAFLLEYEFQKRAQNDSIIFPLDYYSYLQRFDLNEHKNLTSSSLYFFLNRIKNIQPLQNAYVDILEQNQPKSFEDYLFDELGLTPSEEDMEFMEMHKKIFKVAFDVNLSEEEKDNFVNKHNSLANKYRKKYKQYDKAYETKHVKNFVPKTEIEQKAILFQKQDSLLSLLMNTEQGLLTDIIKSQSVIFKIEGSNNKSDKDNEYFSLLQNSLKIPLALQEVQSFYQDKDFNPISLPKNHEGTKYLKSIIDEYKGKVLIVDFWATWCGPCIGNIKFTKWLRDKYKNDPSVAFLYITNEESPENRYNQLVEEQGLNNSVRVPNDEFRLYQDMLEFTGIPFVVLFDKQGKIIKRNLLVLEIEALIEKME